MTKQYHDRICLYYQYFLAIGIVVAVALTVLILFWFLISAVHAHPGGTDKDGCHKVSKDYQYIVSKKVVKAGTTHCHGGLGKMRLGKEILEDPYDAAEETKPAKKVKK